MLVEVRTRRHRDHHPARNFKDCATGEFGVRLAAKESAIQLGDAPFVNPTALDTCPAMEFHSETIF